MAPEQAGGKSKEIGPAVDVYALGAILYECLTGRPPFQAATLLETLELVRSSEPVPPGRLQPRVPRDLETICLSACTNSRASGMPRPRTWPTTCAASRSTGPSRPGRWA
jgi:eukaryotic-like serine/threonine-protein kinase